MKINLNKKKLIINNEFLTEFDKEFNAESKATLAILN